MLRRIAFCLFNYDNLISVRYGIEAESLLRMQRSRIRYSAIWIGANLIWVAIGI